MSRVSSRSLKRSDSKSTVKTPSLETHSLSAVINEKTSLLWSISDKLAGVYKPHEYGEVLLPLTVIRRFDCVLAPTKAAVLEEYKRSKKLAQKDLLLCKASKLPFYNTSPFTFEKLLDDPDNIESNFRSYLNGFSRNVFEILENFKFDVNVSKLAKENLLYIALKEFTTDRADFHPKKISNLEMGYLFEEIVRRFSEAHNEDAGQHYTPREVIELMVNLLFIDSGNELTGKNITKTLYDPACGTGGMLSVAESYLHRLNSDLKLIVSGQEINDQTFAICRADILIKGYDADNIKIGNTLSSDQFSSNSFDFVLSNPPFGREWKNDKKAIEQEFQLGFKGRFGAGLPPVGDGQMLFLQTAISKMKESGARIAIVHNGSPLFTGDAGSGPSNIRKYILEEDLLEAIIALPTDLFYNTSIATYIWVLSNKKEKHRKGKVQLINASEMYEKRRKSLGNKRNDIPQKYIDEITRIYGGFKESEISKIFRNEDFGYSKVVVERPLLDEKGNPVCKKGKNQPDTSLRDTENIPLTEDIQTYFEREVLPFAPDAWIDHSKTKVGYEIPFTRYFYKYTPPQPSRELLAELITLEALIAKGMESIKQSLIYEAVTKGLDPNVPMKDSGIEWIGKIPEDWEVGKLSQIAMFINGYPFSGSELSLEKEVPVVRIGDIHNQTVFLDNCLCYEQKDELVQYKIKNKDILIAMTGNTGKVAYITNECLAYINQRVGIIRGFKYSRFIFYCTLIYAFLEYVGLLSVGSIQSNISTKSILNFLLPILSDNHLKQITSFLDDKCSAIDKTIDLKQEAIEKLKAYKQSLIYEAVTGKIEV